MSNVKKNPKFQLENYSKLFFQIGLVLSLFIIYFLMEYKTFDSDSSSNLVVVNISEELKEDIPIVMSQELPPPPKSAPVILEKIKIVENDVKITESIIESTETDETKAVVISTKEIVEVRESEEIIEDIPFVLIEDVPVFPGCKGNNAALKKCFSDKITEFFGKNFDASLTQELGLSP